jgi:tetratricopeptide (TPR) repeat protein
MCSANGDPGEKLMLKKTSSVLLMVVLLAAPSLGQEAAGTASQQPAAPSSLADLSIPELLTGAERLRAAQRYDEAIKALSLVLQKDPSNIDALRLMGDIAWDSGNAELARQNWREVLKIQSNDFGANFGLGRLELSSGVGRNALHYLEIAASVAPADRAAEVLIALARAYDGSRMRDQAIETIRKALTFDSSSFEGWYVLARLRTEVAVDDEGFNQALDDAERLLEIVGNELQVNGITRENVQKLQLAYQVKLDALKSSGEILFEPNPDGTVSDRILPGKERQAAATISESVDVLLRLAELRQTLAYFDIVELAEKAVEYDQGTNPSTLLDLGWLQKATGQTNQAIETFRRVLELDPGNEAARRQLGTLQAPAPFPAAGSQPARPLP